MGSILYNFLSESFLLDARLVDEHYSSISEQELQSELNRYREFCLGHVKDLLEEVTGPSTALRLFGGKSFQRIETLKQSAFYLDAVVLPDPLFPLTQRGLLPVSKTPS
jgi:hypothetical protein